MLPIKEIEILLALEKQIKYLKVKIQDSKLELETLEFLKPKKLQEIAQMQTNQVKLEVQKENFVKELSSAKHQEQEAVAKLEELARQKLLHWLKSQNDILVNSYSNNSQITKLPERLTIGSKTIYVSEIIKQLIN